MPSDILSALSLSVRPEPCQPSIMATVLDCYTNSVLVDWTHSEGALAYMTTAHSASNHVVNCTTNYTNCELGPLECSQTYTLTTVALGQACDSDVSGSVQLASGRRSPPLYAHKHCLVPRSNV